MAQHRRRPAERVRSPGGESGSAAIEVESPEPGPDTAWETAFEQTLLAALLDVVRRQSNPRDFVAFELAVLQERSPAEVARITGMTRNMVYKARRTLLRRLRELAGDYVRDGQLCQRLRSAVAALPEAPVERSLTEAIETMRQGRY